MPEIDFTTALGRLLTDAVVRRDFAKNPRNVANSLGLVSIDCDRFCALDIDGVNTQAMALLSKRMYEVRNFIPYTVKALGSRYRETFMAYANERWPQGHQRHLYDAIYFCQGLLVGESIHLCRVELNFLQFMASRNFVPVRVFRQPRAENSALLIIQFLYRDRKKNPRYIFWSSSVF